MGSIRCPSFLTPMSLPNSLLVIANILIGLYFAGLALYLVLRLLTGDRYWQIALLNNSAPYVVLPVLPSFLVALLLRSPLLLIAALSFLIICAIWFAPYILPKPRQLPANSTIRVITFNMWGGNPMQAELTAWLRSQNADIVLLQEVPLGYERKHIADMGSIYPYFYRQQTPGRWWTNAVLSKFPITTITDLDSDNQSPSTRQRLVLELSGRQIALYSIHLTFTKRAPRIRTKTWSILNSITSYDESHRNQEIDCLLSELSCETLPYIMAGDFNMSAQSVKYQELAARMYDSFREAGHGLGGTWPNGGVLNLPRFVPPLLRIDYIWHSDHLRAITANVGPDIGSDHHPVIVELEFIPNET